MCVCIVAKLCPTLYCDPMDCSPPGSSVHGILQARTLEWVVIFFSRGSSRPRDRTHVSGLAVDSLPVSHSLISYCQPTPSPSPTTSRETSQGSHWGAAPRGVTGTHFLIRGYGWGQIQPLTPTTHLPSDVLHPIPLRNPVWKGHCLLEQGPEHKSKGWDIHVGRESPLADSKAEIPKAAISAA